MTKKAKEIKLDGITYTEMKCSYCGRVTRLKGKITSKGSKQAIERPCGTCERPTRQCGTNWWHQFGLKKNPFVYGPMQYKRTSERWRLEEARQRGWLAWYWQDELTEQRVRQTHVGEHHSREPINPDKNV